MELVKLVIDYVLDNLDITDTDAVMALIIRLEIAKKIITEMKPWDADDVLPLIFPEKETAEVQEDAGEEEENAEQD